MKALQKAAVFDSAVLAAIVSLRLYLLYWGFIYDRFLVPPGDDAANHLKIINRILTGHTSITHLGYPPGYHLLIAGISRVTHLEPLAVVTYSGPLLVGAIPITVYWFTKRWFNRTAGLLAAALVGLAGAGPVLAYGDGNYPNLLGSGVLMVLGLLYAGLAVGAQSRRNSLIAVGFFLVLAMTHHLSLLMFSLIAGSWMLVLVIGHSRFGRRLVNIDKLEKVIIPGFFAALAFGFLLYGKTIVSFVSIQLHMGAVSSYVGNYLTTPVPLGQYPETVGALVWVIGIVGLIMLGVIDAAGPWQRRWFVIAWALALFVVSRLSFGVPARMVRELSVPLAVAGGVGSAWLIGQAKTSINRLVVTGVLAMVVVVHTVMLTSGPFLLPEGFTRLVWFWPEDQQKLAVLQLLPENARIVATPSSPYYEVLLKKRFLEVNKDVGNNQYLFIGNKPRTNPDERAYPYFADFDTIKATLLRFQLARTIYRFPDGAVIKSVHLP